MDLDALKYLSDEDKNRYMILERLFNQPGWEIVVGVVKQLALDSKDRAAFASSWEANRLAIGQGFAYNHIATFQDSTEAEFQQKSDEAKAKASQQDEEDYE